MPGVDGTTLLRAASEVDPSIVRSVLSGQASEETALRVVRVAHQFLAKPCDAKTIRQVVEHTAALQQRPACTELRKRVGSVDRLPSALRLIGSSTRFRMVRGSGGAPVAEVASGSY